MLQAIKKGRVWSNPAAHAQSRRARTRLSTFSIPLRRCSIAASARAAESPGWRHETLARRPFVCPRARRPGARRFCLLRRLAARGRCGQGRLAATLEAAFGGLQPDMKVLEFETNQPEFKTPIWDYMAGLVDDERVADGKAAMARERRARWRSAERALRRRAAMCWRRSGASSRISARTWASGRWCSR